MWDSHDYTQTIYLDLNNEIYLDIKVRLQISTRILEFECGCETAHWLFSFNCLLTLRRQAELSTDIAWLPYKNASITILYDILQNTLLIKFLATPFWSTTTTVVTTTTKIVTTISSTTAEDVYVTEPYEPSGDFEGSAWDSNDDEDFSNNEYGTVQEETIIYHDMSTYDVKLYLRDQPESNQTENFIRYLRIQFPQIRSVCKFDTEEN